MSLIRFFLRWSWVMVIMPLLGAAAGYAFLQYGPVPYTSSAALEVRPQADVSGDALVLTNPGRATTSAVALAGQAASPAVYDATSRALSSQIEISSDELRLLVENGRITITPVGTSSFISITASDPDPNRAWLLADGYARGFIDDVRAQTRVVTEQRQIETQAEIDILQKQLTQIPLTFNNAGVAETFNNVHAKLQDSLIHAQARLQLLSQAEQPVARYGETSLPMVIVSPLRVISAGAAAGGTFGLIIAYLFELLRQWRKARASRRASMRAATAKRQATVPARATRSASGGERSDAPNQDERGRRAWAGFTSR